MFDDGDMEQKQVELYNFLGSCSQSEFEQKIVELGPNASIDLVRIEIARAIHRKDINIIPVVPETTETFNYSKLNLPDDIVGIKRYEAVFYSDNPDALFKDVVPKIIPRLHTKPTNPAKKCLLVSVPLLLVAFLCFGLWQLRNHQKEVLMQSLKIETALDGQQYLNWSEDITLEQLEAINHILGNMVSVEGGTYTMGPTPNSDSSYDEDVDVDLETPPSKQTVASFWMCKYEVSVSEWRKVMGIEYDAQQADIPIANVSFDECVMFCEKLNDLTGLEFRLPTEIEWEYAARGGITPDSTKYAGSDNPGEVAWYGKNAHDKPHVCDATNSHMRTNGTNLYDMSGNVSEWCDTDFRPYNPAVPVIDAEAKVIRGGNYDSEAYGITVYHREPMNTHEKAPTVGLRLVISNN